MYPFDKVLFSIVGLKVSINSVEFPALISCSLDLNDKKNRWHQVADQVCTLPV